MKIPLSPSEAIFREQKSRFIGILLPVLSEEDMRHQIRNITREYHDATHVCYAFRLYDTDRGLVTEGKTDAGEPPGTAGEPILQQLQHHEVVNVVLVVVRYFGGIKLGKGGLARAYRTCALSVIENTRFSPFTPKSRLNLRVPYDLVGIVQNIVYKYDGEVVNREFSDITTMEVMIPNDRTEEFKENVVSASSGKITFSSTNDFEL